MDAIVSGCLQAQLGAVERMFSGHRHGAGSALPVDRRYGAASGTALEDPLPVDGQSDSRRTAALCRGTWQLKFSAAADRRRHMPAHLMATLPAFLAYFAVAMVLLALFLLIYLNVTPYHEMTLIRAGNTRGRGQPGGCAARFRHAGGQRHCP
jgi:hypothetical protein